MSLEVRDLSFSYGRASVLKNVSFSTEDGELVAMLGPNGVGKSTLFRCVLGFLRPDSGEIFIDGRPVSAFTRREFAAHVAYIPQSVTPTFNFTVLEMVCMGFTSRLSAFQPPTRENRDEAMAVLESLGVGRLAGRGCAMISGGERQMALLARALVQKARVLVMDEPTANLDYGNSFGVMERIEGLTRRGFTVLFSTHDPNQAFRHATRALVLKDGGVLADGDPSRSLTEEALTRLYGVGVAVRQVTAGGESISVSLPYRS